MNYEVLVAIIQHTRVKVRAKLKAQPAPETWANWLIIPVPGYLELNTTGPYPASEFEWLEINPVTTEYIGRLLPPRSIDNSAKLEADLQEKDIPYAIANRIIRITC